MFLNDFKTIHKCWCAVYIYKIHVEPALCHFSTTNHETKEGKKEKRTLASSSGFSKASSWAPNWTGKTYSFSPVFYCIYLIWFICVFYCFLPFTLHFNMVVVWTNLRNLAPFFFPNDFCSGKKTRNVPDLPPSIIWVHLRHGREDGRRSDGHGILGIASPKGTEVLEPFTLCERCLIIFSSTKENERILEISQIETWSSGWWKEMCTDHRTSFVDRYVLCQVVYKLVIIYNFIIAVKKLSQIR